MSYGIGVVVLKEDLDKEEIRYDFCDWTLPITVKVYPEECKRDFSKDWYPSFEKEEKKTTLDKLKTAPCDCVCIIDKDGNFETLGDRHPVDGNKHPIKEYLTI